MDREISLKTLLEMIYLERDLFETMSLEVSSPAKSRARSRLRKILLEMIDRPYIETISLERSRGDNLLTIFLDISSP